MTTLAGKTVFEQQEGERKVYLFRVGLLVLLMGLKLYLVAAKI
jgi:hypothetical protein